MALFTVQNLSFSYDEQAILQDVSFAIDEGEFVAICGLTGSGKSTLLRLLKKELQPAGQFRGTVLFNQLPLEEARTTAISFVMQKPDEQLTMEKVWQELAFPLENLAIPTDEMEQRIAEVMHFLGIHHLFQHRTTELSGGQKQLVNLAAALVTQPQILLMDEPTSQLDPLAATQFIQILERINRELGIAICIIEHRLEELLPVLNHIILLEDQTILYHLEPRTLLKNLTTHPLLRAFGAAPFIFNEAQLQESPLTINEAKRTLARLDPLPPLVDATPSTSTQILALKDICFRYGRKEKDLLTNVHLSINQSDILAIVGGNGTGKSTLLQTIAGLTKPYKGKMVNFTDNKNPFALLPQNPQSIFMKNTVAEEFTVIEKLNPVNFHDRKNRIIEHFNLQPILHLHPLDLSGGQQQLVAFAKIYCLNRPILLLDEPTKGLDVQAKQLLLEAIQRLKQEGKTIILVTHDLDFAAECATHCTMLFQGHLTTIQTARNFFCTNRFYTTSTRRIAADFSNAITCDEVINQLLKLGAHTHA